MYHVFNRRTDCQLLFPSPRAYDDFIGLIEHGRAMYDVRVCTYCAMDTHWHQAIWVQDEENATLVTKYLRWLSSSHALRFRRRSDTRGHGHVYQDRYKANLVNDAAHYLTVVRYIEANPVAAGLVDRAEHWPWAGLAERMSRRRRIICDGPVPLPVDWTEIVNTRSEVAESAAVDAAAISC